MSATVCAGMLSLPHVQKELVSKLAASAAMECRATHRCHAIPRASRIQTTGLLQESIESLTTRQVFPINQDFVEFVAVLDVEGPDAECVCVARAPALY